MAVRHGAHAVTPRGVPITQEQRTLQALRSARQREFLPMQRLLMAPGAGIDMPIVSYSGSYHPAPSPTSRRPPHTRSSVAIDLARTDAGRNASQNTSVPSRTSGTLRASAARVTTGS